MRGLGPRFAEMANLYEANDYRSWLRSALRTIRSRHPARTSKVLASQLEVDPAHLSRVLNGRKHLAVRHAEALARFLDLPPEQARYLETLIRRDTAATPAEANRRFLELQAMRGALHRTLEDDAHAYFSSWIHPVMRTLLSVVEFRGTSWARLAALFRRPIQPDEARESVELLIRLGLVAPDGRGILRPTGGTVSSGESWEGEAVLEFQRQTMRLAIDLLDLVPRAERDVSTLTLPASKARMEELRDRIRRFRQETMAWARDLPEEDCVVQLNLQLLPVAEVRSSRRARLVGVAS